MKKYFYILLALIPVCLSSIVNAQELNKVIIDKIFGNKNEIYFSIQISGRDDIQKLTRVVSIDDVNGLAVHAYANRKQFGNFLELGYPYEVLPHPGSQLNEEELNMGGKYNKGEPLTTWNFYPTYTQYIDAMNGFAESHPAICKVVTIGTTPEGRQLLAVKISDSLDVEQGEPQVFLTSSIHGDELTGYVLMLHLIDSLLTGYGQNIRITNLVNNYQIVINPLANPDGTYLGGNTTVMGAIRENANYVDLNRNFPDPTGDLHPDGNDWQPETMAMMRFDSINHFVMSINFHGGEEVVNYPWDCWSKLHADNSWFDFVGREYADSNHVYGPPGYFTGPSYSGNGVTNGYAWYEVHGGRQDYTTYFHNGREVTLEISVTKTPPADQLVNFWNYNVRSFLDYIEESGYGVNGRITDSVTNQPVQAKVVVLGHDKDNSYVYSKLPSGWYFRPIFQGTYSLTFSAPDYHSKTITGVSVSNRSTTRLNVGLVPLSIGVVNEAEREKILLFPNPTNGITRIQLPETTGKSMTLQVFNTLGVQVYSEPVTGYSRELNISVNLSFLEDGLYILKLTGDKQTYESRLIIRK
jgi:hypothetical protein